MLLEVIAYWLLAASLLLQAAQWTFAHLPSLRVLLFVVADYLAVWAELSLVSVVVDLIWLMLVVA